MKQMQVYHGNKEAKDCYIRIKNKVYKPVVEEELERVLDKEFKSISQAKQYTLSLMKQGQQIRSRL